jgi:hypothetical protein
MDKTQYLAKIHDLVAQRRVLSDKVKSLWSGIQEVRKQRSQMSDQIKNLHSQMRALPKVVAPQPAPAPVATLPAKTPEVTKPAGIGAIAAALKKTVAPKPEHVQVGK